ncbi:MAG: ribosome-associated translation inhibitor RaiA [Candidatus Brocadiae bacterium]|nr:ribosome-associated translation inhibitor RaiA [Candidatus Brocadiia bacterium]
MDVEITGRHIEVTEPMERHIRQRIEKLPPFADKVQYLTVRLKMEAGNQLVEITAKCGRTDLLAQAGSHDMYQSIDDAFAKLERQLARYHDKRVNRARAAQRASEDERLPE